MTRRGPLSTHGHARRRHSSGAAKPQRTFEPRAVDRAIRCAPAVLDKRFGMHSNSATSFLNRYWTRRSTMKRLAVTGQRLLAGRHVDFMKHDGRIVAQRFGKAMGVGLA